MRIVLATDAWKPQMNGVTKTLSMTVDGLREMGHEVEVISPADGYWTMPLPTYPDIPIAPFVRRDVKKRLKAFRPQAVHIASEGPIGQAARKYCRKWNMPFSTSYHTKFPEYIKARFPFLPISWSYRVVRNFHNSGKRVMVTTPSMASFLEDKGFKNLAVWSRGVTLEQFNPQARFNPEDVYKDLPRPVFVNVGRVSVEKNIEAFLDLDLPGSKVVVGTGPHLETLKEKYPHILFTGAKFGDELARYFADADVFVFPSLTDTFGLVNIEAMATGTPAAGYPVSGPIDIIPGSGAGVIDEDLKTACIACLDIDRAIPAEYAKKYSWENVAQLFFGYLCPLADNEVEVFWNRLGR